MGNLGRLSLLIASLACLLIKSTGFQTALSKKSIRLTSKPIQNGVFQSFTPRQPRTLASSNNINRDRPERPGIIEYLKRLATYPARIVARFRALSRRAKRLVVVQFLVFACAFGGVAHNTVTNVPSRSSPIEISYSSFLDIVEQQQNPKTAVPSMDQVRIGNDRIAYRLRRKESDDATKPKATKKPASPFLNAFTRKVHASPELLGALRKADVPFAAAPIPRSSVLSLAIRSCMVTFYVLILWRLYKTVGGNSGGLSDSPGKLARASDLPMASFDEIQGIDDAKMEVMELVDTLRNPDKYAILGARAPTGLLLEGPPGTGTLTAAVFPMFVVVLGLTYFFARRQNHVGSGHRGFGWCTSFVLQWK
jgi:hypothetical protein